MKIQPSRILLGACIAEIIMLLFNSDRMQRIFMVLEGIEFVVFVIRQVKLMPIYQGCSSNGD